MMFSLQGGSKSCLFYADMSMKTEKIWGT